MTRYERIARLEFTLTLRERSRHRRNMVVMTAVFLLCAVAALAAVNWAFLRG